MHDVFLAKEIFDTVMECARKNGLKKVTKVTIGLGRFEEHGETVSPENLKFNFLALAKDSAANGAELAVRNIRGPYWSLKEIEGE